MHRHRYWPMPSTLRLVPFWTKTNRPPEKSTSWITVAATFYLALFWAEALASQTADGGLKSRFSPLAQSLRENEEKIVSELNNSQGNAVDLGGYFLLDEEKAVAAMRPSQTLNSILN